MDDRDFKFEELKVIIDIGKEYFGFYFRAVILLATILGVFLKLLWDAKPGSEERFSLYIAGLLVSIGGIIMTLTAYPKYMLLANRCKALTDDLTIPDVYFPGTTGISKAFLLILIAVTALWAFLYKFL